MTSMKTLLLGLSAAALTIGGAACAQAPGDAPKDRPGMDRPHGGWHGDADGDGIVTRAEAQARATQMFARLDVNKDGKLDQADREMARQQMREKIFAKLDANGDGSISKAEFMAGGDQGPDGRGPGGDRPGGDRPGDQGPGPDGMDAPPPPPPPGDAAKGPPVRGGPAKFAGRFGHGPDGGPGAHHGGPRGGMMMEEADTNHDGSVSQAEFVAAALKRFDAEDANHDGKVTPEERQAARKAHMDERKARWDARKAQTKADKPAAN